MENKCNKSCCGIGSNSKVGIALLLVLAGGLLLGFNLGFIPIEYKKIFISWQMLVIVVGFLSLFKRHFVGGFSIIAIGTFFLLPIIGECFPEAFGDSLSNVHAYYWPILLIVGGILFLFKKSDTKRHKCGDSFKPISEEPILNKEESESGYVEKSVMFSGSEQIVFSRNFRGGELNVVFGEIKLDLRKVSEVNEQNRLEINAMFGAAIIYVPDNWKLNLKTSSMFGDIKDKRYAAASPAEKTEFTLNVQASCLFGSIEIRN